MSIQNLAVARRLNRLIVAGWDEIVACAAAARIVQGTEARERLLQQAARRGVFRHDLSAAAGALGALPASGASLSAKISAGARGLRGLLAGPHQGDAYAACARATEKTASEYVRALGSHLPADIRFGIEQEYSEVEFDCRELRRLRWGARQAPTTSKTSEPSSS